MTLAQPTMESDGSGLTYAECTRDYFEVDGMKLCGTEVWQHMYVPFNATDGSGLPTAYWDMTVTQLECPAGASVRSLDLEDDVTIESRASTIKDGFFVAPPGCRQYFPHPKGAVKSFNYNDGNGIYPSRMNYAICFRRQTDTKTLT
ncbi:GD12232 [Drosophila simulans]|uniref:GD12232 n=1 Tax=Drosophila simulans TaxID=7240 RepID=B4QRF2_DROSI|nr:GD12232 [Drosophila simulans]